MKQNSQFLNFIILKRDHSIFFDYLLTLYSLLSHTVSVLGMQIHSSKVDLKIHLQETASAEKKVN